MQYISYQMSSDCYGPGTPTGQAITAILANQGVDEQGAEAVYSELQSRLDPVINQAATTLVEALITQVVFFVIVVLILLIVAVVVLCSLVLRMTTWEVVAIVFLLLVLAVVLLVIVSFYALNAGTSAIDTIVQDVTLGITSDTFFAAINNAAYVYISTPA